MSKSKSKVEVQALVFQPVPLLVPHSRAIATCTMQEVIESWVNSYICDV